MVDKKITALTELTTPVAADVIAIVDDPAGSPVTKKITYANVESNLSITASQVSDFDTEVSNNSSVTANTSASHAQSHTVVSHSDTTATGAELDTLTGGGDTTLHDHDGISENTSARHTQNTDTALGTGAVAADHGTDSTDQIINISYGTGATPPTASTTTEGSLYVQYSA